MACQTPTTIGKALDRIARHDYLLPAIQRECVWKTEQIARLFDSLLQGFPIGSSLFWSVDTRHAHDFVLYAFMTNYHQRKSRHLKRHDLTEPRAVTAVLDGQQQLASLNLGLRGSHAEELPRKWADNLSADLRPHDNGFMLVQERAGELVHRWLSDSDSPDSLLARLDAEHWLPQPEGMA